MRGGNQQFQFPRARVSDAETAHQQEVVRDDNSAAPAGAPANSNILPVPLISEIKRAVVRHFLLTTGDMTSPSRKLRVCRPRQVAMHLARELTRNSYPRIGMAFGGRDHTTVMFAQRRIHQLMRTDAALELAVVKLTRELLETAERRIAHPVTGPLVTVVGIRKGAARY